VASWQAGQEANGQTGKSGPNQTVDGPLPKLCSSLCRWLAAVAVLIEI